MTFDNDGHALKKLHARLADSHAGYRNGIHRTCNTNVAAFFEGFRAMHEGHMIDLHRLMRARGLRPKADGTWATLNHAGMMAFRDGIERLDGSIIDAAIRGERTLLDLYDEALEAVGGDGDARAVLLGQRAEIVDCMTGGDGMQQAA